MTLISIIGISASVFTAMSLIPQLVKLIKEKKAENISLGMLAILFAGLGLWTYYGLLREDLIIILANSFSFIINIILAGFAIMYKKKN
ncbi:MAG: hypothetical protein H7Z13_10305 [Ferruginibacter sp.]|nr:hypothetical protein [Ferruginibacter sp.]